jgi:hypothetical protein
MPVADSCCRTGPLPLSTDIDTVVVNTAHQLSYRCNAGIWLIIGLSLRRWLLRR